MELIPRSVPRSDRLRYVAFCVTVCLGSSILVLGLLLSLAPGTSHFDVAVFQVSLALFALAFMIGRCWRSFVMSRATPEWTPKVFTIAVLLGCIAVSAFEIHSISNWLAQRDAWIKANYH